MINFGMMQGRLTEKDALQQFPYDNWEKEISLLSDLGFNSIEWLVDKRKDEKNIFFNTKFSDLKNELEINKIYIDSVCLHYLVKNPINFIEGSDNSSYEFLKDILSICYSNKIKNVILPISDKLLKSKIKNLYDFFNLISNLKFMNKDIKILFEVDSELELACDLLDDLNQNDAIYGLCYDLGNASFFGRSIIHDFKLLNKYIYEIHIKDKDEQGNNVYLGDGKVKFDEFKTEYPKLEKLNNLIFETNTFSDPINVMSKNIKFMKAYL